MKTYNVEVRETLSRFIKVEAINKDEAYQLVRKMYCDEEIVLNEDDFINLDITVMTAVVDETTEVQDEKSIWWICKITTK